MRSLIVLFCCSTLLFATARGADTLSLAGEWSFRMDPQDKGVEEKWFAGTLPEKVHLPGSMLENGKGEEVTVNTQWTASIYDSSWFFDPRMAKYRQQDNLKFPFWLTPAKHYAGAAWYQQSFVLPAGWADRHLVLYLERPHSETSVWVDDKEIGQQYGFCTAQEFDLSGLKPGPHTITLRIDNRIKAINVGQDSHSLTDQTQGNWNGVVGQLLLISRPATWLDDIQVFPDIQHKQVRVRLLVRSLKASGSGTITLYAESFNTSIQAHSSRITVNYTIANEQDSLSIDLPMGEKVLTWDEFDPALYRLQAVLSPGGSSSTATDTDRRTVEFGMREFRVRGTQFEVNGRTVALRGTVENCVFPLTGYAPMDEAAWEKIFRIARSFGFNHMRFHSYSPPEAAFMAADRVGFYLQPEGPSWANHGSSLGDGKPIDQFIFDETNRMDRAYGNYASFCMLAYGNEPRGGHQLQYLTRFVNYWKEKDSRRVYTGADVGGNWPLIPDNEYMVKSGARGLSWDKQEPESLSDYDTIIHKYNVPYVAHEMGQWCAYPDFSEIPAYTGVYKAKNFELFREGLEEQGMGAEARDFLLASGKLQVLCYKAEIEKSLRTKDAGGFQMLSITDYPGQGTALVGVLNALWQEKGYCTAAEFSRFCNSTVPLARLPKFVFTNTENLDAAIELYHYGKAALPKGFIDWTLKNDHQQVIAKGSFRTGVLPIGNCIPIGHIRQSLSAVKEASHLYLEVSVRNTTYVNGWDCWVYPASLPGGGAASGGAADSIYYCTDLDSKARQVLEDGGKVFLNASGKVVKGKEVSMHFTPVFWNTSWFKMRPPHTLGILCDPTHPAFNYFPTSYHSDLQWWDILYKAQPMHLEDFPRGFRPLVQPIDTWFLNRRLGLIFEASVGKGRLIVSSADLSPDTGSDRPAARQLYYSIQRYMQSTAFHPAASVDFATIKDLFVIDRKALVERHTVVNTTTDSLSSLSLGNGRFAVTVDITGLQSFPESYDKGVPLGTESQWGWHSFRDTSGFRPEEALKEYNIHGRKVSYSVQWSSPLRNRQASDWFRQNVHRLQLGNIGLELIRKDGRLAGLPDIRDIHQELNMWTGEIRSHFTLEGVPVDVRTYVHPDKDLLAVSVHSALLKEGRLRIRVRLPYPTGAFADAGDNWEASGLHVSSLLRQGDSAALIRHELDTTTYFIGCRWTGPARMEERQAHYFLLTPAAAAEFEFSCQFSPGSDLAALPSFTGTAEASATAWRKFWLSGGAVDFSGSTDPRAMELERRVVLSQYLTRIQEAGDYPPQETGLTYNSWYGKPHLEMHWWHSAHFALWGRPELLESSLDWYRKVADKARIIAERQGYKGVRWQKMTDPEGRESPSSVGAFLIWQQPHFIYLTELCYRQLQAKEGAAAARQLLEKYKDLVFATADFMASYAWYDLATHRYILGKGLIPAQERFRQDSTFDPAYELAYWRWALSVAQQWRSRLGMGPEPEWLKVEKRLAPLPVQGGLYLPTESATDAYTNERYRTDHPAVLGTFGFLPSTEGMDTAVMHSTFDWIWQHWRWEDTWGWDFPLTAMSATRLGMPDKAIDALLMPVKKNTYLPDGHNYQDDRLRIYLPGNGGLLSAISLMCAGYDGCAIPEPGIPKDGKWKVRWEGLFKMP